MCWLQVCCSQSSSRVHHFRCSTGNTPAHHLFPLAPATEATPRCPCLWWPWWNELELERLMKIRWKGRRLKRKLKWSKENWLNSVCLSFTSPSLFLSVHVHITSIQLQISSALLRISHPNVSEKRRIVMICMHFLSTPLATHTILLWLCSRFPPDKRDAAKCLFSGELLGLSLDF